MISSTRIIILQVTLSFIIALWGCESQPEQQKVAPKKQAAPVSQKAPADNKVRAVKTSWPPLDRVDIELVGNPLMKNYYVILDCSGSMSEKQCYGEGSKLAVAQNAITSFAQLVPDNANLGFSIFVNNQFKELVSLGKNNRDEIISAIRSTYPSGQTPLRSAIEVGFRRLTDQASRQLGYGEYALVVVTDGLASQGEDPTPIVHRILDNTPVEIHTIGFCIGENHPLNIPGKTVYKAANSQEDLQRGLQGVLAESESFDVSDFPGIK